MLSLYSAPNTCALASHIDVLVREIYHGMGGVLPVIGALFTANPQLGDAVGEDMVWQLVALAEAAREAPLRFPEGTAVDVVRLHTFRPLADYAEVIHSSSTHGLTHCCASRGRGRIYKEGMQLTQCPPSPPGLNCRAAPTTRVSSGIDAAGMY